MGDIQLQCTISRKSAFKVLLVLVILFVIHILVMDHVTVLNDYKIQPLPVRQPDIVTLHRKVNNKLILIWTPFNVPHILDIEESCMTDCPVKCSLTNDTSRIKDANIVNFHLVDLWTENWVINTKATIQFPSYRRSDQIWAITNLEPPPNLFGNLRVFNGVFNWTVWYRKDANVYFPYGVAEKLNQEKDLLAAHPVERNYFKEKTNGITGKISNCKDTARRYRLVEELRKYLDLDMFGKCYNRVCGDPEKHATCDNITQTYKFYLALENSRCRDYVTEKYWWALHRDQIPIVNWDLSHVNKNTVIPNSYISIYDFPDLQSFSGYISKVSNNETLYNSYFDWKKTYKIRHTCPSCLLCQALHEYRPSHVVEDFDAWVQNDKCDKVGVSRNSSIHISSASSIVSWQLFGFYL